MSANTAPGATTRDTTWFDALFTAHARAVYRYVRRRMSDAVEAEDLAADVLATAWRRRQDIPEGMELAWLYRTASYVLANHRRKQRPIPLAELPEEKDTTDIAFDAVRDDQVRRALGALSERDRTILLLHAWDGMDPAGLAVVLGISRGGADAALSRARARLRAAWTEAESSADPGSRPAVSADLEGHRPQDSRSSGHSPGEGATAPETDILPRRTP